MILERLATIQRCIYNTTLSSLPPYNLIKYPSGRNAMPTCTAGLVHGARALHQPLAGQPWCHSTQHGAQRNSRPVRAPETTYTYWAPAGHKEIFTALVSPVQELSPPATDFWISIHLSCHHLLSRKTLLCQQPPPTLANFLKKLSIRYALDRIHFSLFSRWFRIPTENVPQNTR